jgi:hypothetical protein
LKQLLLKKLRRSTQLNSTFEAALKTFSGEENLSAAVESVVSLLKLRGYVVIPGALNGALLENVCNEFERAFECQDNVFYGVDRHEGSTCLRLKPLWGLRNLFKFKNIMSFYACSVIERIASEYFGARSIDYISEVFIHRTPATENPLSGNLHWDRHQTLKFWIYVDDVDNNSGAMRIIPESHHVNSRTRLSKGPRGELIGGVDNLCQSGNEFYLSGCKGSLMIFDTDLCHGASPVSFGFERKIIRGHCRIKEKS